MKKVLISIFLGLTLAACGQGPSGDVTKTTANNDIDRIPVSSTVISGTVISAPTDTETNTEIDTSSETSEAPDLSASGVRCWPITAKLESTDTTITQYRFIFIRWSINEPSGCSGYKYTISRSTPAVSYVVGNAGYWTQQPLVKTKYTLKIKWKNKTSKKNIVINVTPYQ